MRLPLQTDSLSSVMINLPYRPNVCMLLHNDAGKLFLGERLGQAGVWQFPQGGIEPGTTPEEAVIRELEEECGIPPALIKIELKLAATHTYDFSTPPAYAVGRWRGQSQSFWVVRFLGHDQEIRLDLHKPEFSGWRWCTPQEVRSMAEPKRVVGYEPALREFENYLGAGKNTA